MATDFNRVLADAKKAIRENGREFVAVTVVQLGDAWNPVETEMETPFLAVQTGFTGEEKSRGLVADGDVKLLAAGDIVFTPYTGQTIKDGLDVYRVKRFDTVRPADLTILYKIHLER